MLGDMTSALYGHLGGRTRLSNWVQVKFCSNFFVPEKTWNIVLFLLFERVHFRFCGYSFQGPGSRSDEYCWQFFIRMDCSSHGQYLESALCYHNLRYGVIPNDLVGIVGADVLRVVESISLMSVDCIESLVRTVLPSSEEWDLMKPFGHPDMLDAVTRECEYFISLEERE